MRTLWIDARPGPLSAASLLAALVDLGAAPSPILRATASLGLPVEMRIERDGAVFLPSHHGVLLQTGQVAALLDASDLDERPRLLAADALGRLVLASAGLRGAAVSHLDAGAVLALVGVAVALDDLDAERYVAAPPRIATVDGAALLECIVDESDRDAPEPSWRGVVLRGAAAGVEVALGQA